MALAGRDSPHRDGDGKANRRYTVDVVNGVERINREEWNALLTPDDSPFVEWDWLGALERSNSAIAATGWAPYHLVVRTASDREMVAACPLYLKSHSMGEFVFDHGWAEAAEGGGIRYYPKLLVGVPFTPHSGRRFLTMGGAERTAMIALMGHALLKLCSENKLSSVHVNFCLPDEAQALIELGFSQRLGYQYHWLNAGYDSFDSYLSSLKHKRRYAVRHERAALAAQGVTIQGLVGDEIPQGLAAPMFELYRTTVEKHYWGRQYLTPEFFEQVGDVFKNRLCFICAFRGDELLAGTFNVLKAGVLYGRYWGAFTDLRFLHFNVCYYAGIELCIDRSVSRFEPGAGGEYKWLRGFNPSLTYSAHYIADGRLRRAVDSFLVRESSEVMRWVELGHQHSQLKAPPPSNQEQR